MRAGGVLIGAVLTVGMLVTGQFFYAAVLACATLWHATG